MGDYKDIETQLQQSKPWVEGLNSAEKAQLRPTPPQSTFNWSAFAGAVGAVATLLLIGLFAWILANPSGEIVEVATSATRATAISENVARIKVETLARQARDGRTTAHFYEITSSLLLPADDVMDIVGGVVANLDSDDMTWVVDVSGHWTINGASFHSCTFFIDAETGNEFLTQCPSALQSSSSVEGLINQEEAIASAAEYKETTIAFQLMQTTYTAELVPLVGDSATPYLWIVTLQGMQEEELVLNCEIYVHAMSGEAMNHSCTIPDEQLYWIDPLVSASTLEILPAEIADRTEQFARVVNYAHEPSETENRTRVAITIDYSLVIAERGTLILHWGYFLDETEYGMGDFVAIVEAGSGSATITFEIDDRLVGEWNDFDGFNVGASLRVPHSTVKKIVYLMPKDALEMEQPLRSYALQQVSGNIITVDEWGAVEMMLENDEVSAVIVHYAAAESADKEILQHYYDHEGVIVAGLGVDAKWFVLNGDFDYDSGADTPLYFTFAWNDPNGNAVGWSGDSLIHNGLSHFFSLLETQIAYQNGELAPFAPAPTDWTVTVDIFSGRPNPTWTLDPDTSLELFQLISSAPRQTDGTDRFDNLGLGYRGIVIEYGDVTLRFLDGLIAYQQTGEDVFYLADPIMAIRDKVLVGGEISAEIRTLICEAEPSPTLCSDE